MQLVVVAEVAEVLVGQDDGRPTRCGWAGWSARRRRVTVDAAAFCLERNVAETLAVSVENDYVVVDL